MTRPLAVVAGVPPAKFAFMQPARLPLQVDRLVLKTMANRSPEAQTYQAAKPR